MKKHTFPMTRRQVLQAGAVAGAGLMVPWSFNKQAYAALAAQGLSDPALQPKFTELAPNALDPGFLYKDFSELGGAGPVQFPNFAVRVREAMQQTGLVDQRNGRKLNTRIWGYGSNTVSWPGQTFQVMNVASGGAPETEVMWINELWGQRHLLPVDTNLHWCYSLPGYEHYSIKKNGVPIITHLHGGHTDFQFDGNPEFFHTPGNKIVGPSWNEVDSGFTNRFRYDNDVPAGNLWYHDHALGITRLNVYAGLAGFYFIRDFFDTGLPGNDAGLPAFPYELAYAIQDRMFTSKGDLFYPAFPGDPFYEGFIEDEGANLPPDLFPDGGPTALAEFFGDHMVVNGKIWPKENVEPRNYRMRLLNGCDSRFMVLQFVAVEAGVTDFTAASNPIPFYVIGADQGLGTPTFTDTLVFEPGARYDIVVDFSDSDLAGKRVIMKNIGGDEPFGGDIPGPKVFGETDRVMAFDVVVPLSNVEDNFDPANLPGYGGVPEPTSTTTRRVALFEGTDEFGRLQPLLGTVKDGDLRGTNVATAYTWFQPTTETPALDSTEIWEIYNFTADAHPIHLHLVNFEILDRKDFKYDITGTQTITQHNGMTGEAPEISNIRNLTPASVGGEYFEAAPKDMVTSLPGDPEGTQPTGQMVRVRAKFDKPGRYVWHCHILSHEDHEMMRVLEVKREK